MPLKLGRAGADDFRVVRPAARARPTQGASGEDALMRCARTITIAVALVAAITSNALAGAQRYTNPRFAELTAMHRTLAVVAFHVSIDPNRLPKNMTAEMIQNEQKTEGLDFQKQLYARFLTRSESGGYSITFQDVHLTNALLAKAGINYDNMGEHTMTEIAQVLGVDAIVSGSIERSQPMSTGAAIATGVLLGGLFMGNTHRVDISMSIHNGADGALLWSYDHTDSGGLTDSSEAMAKSLLKKVAGQFPYKGNGRMAEVASH